MDNQDNKPQSGTGNVQASSNDGNQQTLLTPNELDNSKSPTDNQQESLKNDSSVVQEAVDNNLLVNTNNESVVNLDEYTSEIKNSEEKNSSNSDHQKNNNQMDDKSSRLGTIITIVLIIIIVFGIWQSNQDKGGQTGDDDNNVTVVVDSTKETGSVTIVNGAKVNSENSNISGETTKIVAYYNKTSNGNECENVMALERTVEKKYESNVINTVRGLLTPLSSDELSKGWISSIPEGTYLRNITVKDGVAQVVFSSALKNVAGSCRVMAIRSQIEKTILQFSYIKKVNICIDDNCQQDEILQP